MPVHNGMPWIRESIHSILAQAEDIDYLIVINDGSTDGTRDFLEGLNHPKLVVRHTSNRGIAAARNLALDLNTSNFVALMDSDDIALPGRFRYQKTFLRGSNYDMVTNGALLLDKNGEVFGDFHISDLTHKLIKRILIWRNPIVQPSTMFQFNHNSIIRMLRYPDTPIEDYAMWIEIAKNGYIHMQSKPMVKVRIHSRNTSSKSVGDDLNLFFPYYATLIDSLQYNVEEYQWQEYLHFTINNVGKKKTVKLFLRSVANCLINDTELSHKEKRLLLGDLYFHCGRKLKSPNFLIRALLHCMNDFGNMRHLLHRVLTLGNSFKYRKIWRI